MKPANIGLAMVALVAGAPAASAQGPVGMSLAGDLSLAIGGFGSTSGSGYGLFDALGRVNVPLSSVNLEIEVGSRAVFSGGMSEPLGTSVFGHLWHATAGGAWGVFGGVTASGGDTVGAIGGEFKHFLAQASWGAFAAYTNYNSGGLGSFGAAANYYFNANHRIGFGLAALTNFSEAYWTLRLDGEHRFNQIGLWAEGTYTGFSGGSGGIWTALGGVRFYFDAPGSSLQQHERLVPWTYQPVGLLFT